MPFYEDGFQQRTRNRFNTPVESRYLLDPMSPLWRRMLRQASFKGVPFFVDQQGQASGRRTVIHEYPKRDLPYAEDMGRAAYRYQMTGYLIQYPDRDPANPRTRRNSMSTDYSINRDRLRQVLDQVGPGVLNDPYNPNLSHLGYGGQTLMFMCERYTCSESRERGGYCVFEMGFVEAGWPSNLGQYFDASPSTTVDTAGRIEQAAPPTAQEAIDALNGIMGGILPNVPGKPLRFPPPELPPGPVFP